MNHVIHLSVKKIIPQILEYVKPAGYSSLTLILNFIKDGALSNQEILEKAEEIRSEISQANEIGSQFSTNQNDYNKAQTGIKNGEENYTDEELNLWE